MRTAFFRALLELAAADESVNLVVGDLGFGVVEPFVERFPARFFNAGVAEQNMTGIAAGLALSGKTVFTYSIANFPTLRCLEQIRNDVRYHNANVKVVAVGGAELAGATFLSSFLAARATTAPATSATRRSAASAAQSQIGESRRHNST